MNSNRLLIVALAALLAGCGLMPISDHARTPIDQVPMYGGMDRNAMPTLKAGDERFISDAVATLGSREEASIAWVNRGFELYQKNDLAGAMRRFNQAWLLHPDNPEVYWGFALVLYDQNKLCNALDMIELGESKGKLQPGFTPDAALIYTGCAIENTALDSATRKKYLDQSDALFEQAYAWSPLVNKEYTLFHWIRALYAREDYSGAWAKVHQYRKEIGKDPNPRMIQVLSQKMAEPK